MPMLCPICGHVEHSTEEVCGKCGSAMRFSLLAGLNIEDDSQTIRLGDEGLPTWKDRVQQVASTVLLQFLLASALTAAAVVFVATWLQQEESPIRERSHLLAALFGAAALLSTAVAVRWRLCGVFLAQIVGGTAGAMGCAVLYGAKAFLGVPVAWFEWLVVPACAAVGFWVGLRSAGAIAASEAIELKPIDAWDRKAKPTVIEIAPPASRRWRRLLFGAGVGLILVYALPFAAYLLFAPFLRNAGLWAVASTRAELLTTAAAFFGGGMLASSGTRSGAVQGLLAGLLSFWTVQVLTPWHGSDVVLLFGGFAAIFGALGGIVGRRIFGPYRVYGNAATGGRRAAVVAASR
jgi:MFS family permease